MLKRIGLVVLLILPLLAVGQKQDLLQTFLASSPSIPSAANNRFEKHINHLRSFQSKKELAFLHKIFWATQKEFFKSYKPYEAFSELFTSGKYDCLTATGLYSILLTEFNFNHSIIETNYHIFIVIHSTQGDVLFETTDRYKGFVQNNEEIEKRIGTYRQNLLASTSTQANYYQYTFSLYKEINPTQLTGLLHFNQAVNAFNKKDWKLCADQLELARHNYDSQRTKELAALLIQCVMAYGEDDALRQNIVQRFKDYWLTNQPVAMNQD
jgi:hypothetical protein